MTFFSFSGTGSDRPRPPRKHPKDGYGYHHGNATNVTLHRPLPPPVTPTAHIHGPPPPWQGSPPLHPAVASQPYLPLRPPHVGSPPPPQQVYGPPPVYQSPAWASSATLRSPVYPTPGHTVKKTKSSLNLSSMVAAPMDSVNMLVDAWDKVMDSSDALYDSMSHKLDQVITCMDEEIWSGNERDLELQMTPTHASRSSKQTVSTTASSKTNHFAKVWQYSNSRLPPYLPPVKLYLESWPLLSLAARYSLDVYAKPTRLERNDHIKGSHAKGTKAMVLKSLPVDKMNTIVFAIRGTSTFMDWTVNMRQEPASPSGFLDNAENYCHAGFLQVAKAMLRPVAERLRTLLQEDPSRGLASLLITGHSAGGAVAQLLYAHMTSEYCQSELTHLTSFFKRVHCVTFGAPPVSLFPLQHPPARRHRKSMFFAFANEGDPVVRADRTIVKSLLKLYALPAPADSCKVVCPLVNAVAPGLVPRPLLKKKKSLAHLKASSWSGSPSSSSNPQDKGEIIYPAWKVPSSALSLGGRIILMRPRYQGRGHEDLEMCSVDDEMLRGVIYGDPEAHAMKLYARRVEVLAHRAATGGWIVGFGGDLRLNNSSLLFEGSGGRRPGELEGVLYPPSQGPIQSSRTRGRPCDLESEREPKRSSTHHEVAKVFTAIPRVVTNLNAYTVWTTPSPQAQKPSFLA